MYQELIQRKRFQNRVAENRWSALRMVFLSLLIWAIGVARTTPLLTAALSGGRPDAGSLLTAGGSLLCMILAAVMMGQLNSVNALIRIYSRMIMCSFLVIMTIATFLFTDITVSVVTLCAVVFYIFLFRCYQNKVSPGWMFYAYLALGMASVFWVQVLFFLPVLWIVTSTNMIAMSFRNFIASLLGVAAPYWFMLAWYAFTNNLSELSSHFAALADFGSPADILTLDIHHAVTLAFVILLAATGMVHWGNKSHQDNIRTRLFYETFVTIDIVAILFLLLQPRHFSPLYGIIAVNTAPLTGHFMALTHTKWTNGFTIALMVTALAICTFNLWIP